MKNPKIDNKGNKIWYNKNGKLHRKGGPAIIWADGDEEWWFDDKLHRVDGPAVKLIDGHESWCKNGLLHRLDGPAIIGNKNNGYKEWWIDGVEYTKRQFDKKVKEYK